MNDVTASGLFPAEHEIPEPWRLTAPLEQRRYLCDGAIRQWTGPLQDVISPVCEASAGGVRPRRLGSYPLLGEAQALEALEAASRAYDYGRGAWPTLPVEERIRHVE